MTALAGRALLGLSHRLRRSGTLRVLAQIRDEPYVLPEIASARQLERTRALLQYCENYVPFYQRHFAQAGMRAADVKSWDDFGRIPVLTKEALREHREELVSTSVDRSSLLEHHSGGSTGVPLRFYRNHSYIEASEAGTYRNLLQCGWRPGEMIAFFWGANAKIDRMGRLEFVGRQILRRMFQFDPFRSGPTEMERWWRTWRRVRPRVVLGYASTIARFGQFLEAAGHRPAGVKGVYTTAEKLYSVQRRTIEQAFGARVFDCYGSSEVQNIASECPLGSMHINADFSVVETEPESKDGPRPLIVTSLKNFAMPLIRYRNEDCGRVLDERCWCGNGFPLMSLDVTRTSDNFRLPNGRVVHGEYFTHLLYGSEGVDSFQFHQTDVGRIVLRYVAAPLADPAHFIERAVAQVQDLAPGQLEVIAERVPAIAPSNAGKHRFTRSDVS
jgi:phenylacetate-CoA ligase